LSISAQPCQAQSSSTDKRDAFARKKKVVLEKKSERYKDTGGDGAADGGGAVAGSEEEVTKHQSRGKPCSEICMHLDFSVQARLAV
jgi:hypothetical protein